MLNFKDMDTPSLIKWAILAVLVAFSCYVTFPMKDKVRLGLDLQGGTSFTVAIDQEQLKADALDEISAKEKITDLSKVDQSRRDALNTQASAKVAADLRGADETVLEVLRRRIDALGTNEPVITSIGDHRFSIQIPGATDEQRDAARASVGKASFLELRLVARENTMLAQKAMELANARPPKGYERVTCGGTPALVQAPNYLDLLAEDPTIPSQLARFSSPSALFECVLEYVGVADDGSGRDAYRPMYLSRAASTTITGDTVVKATADKDSMKGGNVINVEFNGEGSDKLAQLSSGHTGEQMAIVLDDIVRSAPVLREPITGGHCQISGDFSWAEATRLAGVFNAGALNVPIKIMETRSVSPTLGEEAIQKGTLSAIIGVAAVFLFMLFYYLFCGVIADVALALNVILWPAGMVIAAGILNAVYPSGAESTGSINQLPVLTLPGIAGLVLSVGMAVDANVLIFERMREEFRLGKTVKAAITAGYDRAFLAILDSNLTTLITGVILFIFGSGPIRGFAVTLCGGIIISMFTALVVTRLIFRLVAQDTTKPYKMFQWVPETINIDFLKFGKPLTIAAFAVIVATVGLFLYRAVSKPADVMAVDFTGGLSLTYEATEKANPDSVIALDADLIRDAINDAGIADPTVQNATAEGGKTQTLVKIPDVGQVSLPVADVIRGTVGHGILPGYAITLAKAENGTYTYAAKKLAGEPTDLTALDARLVAAFRGEKAIVSLPDDPNDPNDFKVTVTPAENGDLSFAVTTTAQQVALDAEEALRVIIDNATPDFNIASISRDQVGSQIGDELKSAAVWSIIASLICIILYVSYRFQFGFALGGVVALAHDALMTLGVYSLCGNQVSLTTVAALLTIVGYSINDTIVAFDRVREIMEREPTLDFPTAMRRGLNQTLSRTVLTTLSTLMPVAALYFFGGAAMHDFAFALFVGMVAGTFSTLFIAPVVTVAWYRGKRPNMPADRKAEQAKAAATTAP